LVNKLAGDMAPKAGKAKPHKAKGDRKKKEEKGAANYQKLATDRFFLHAKLQKMFRVSVCSKLWPSQREANCFIIQCVTVVNRADEKISFFSIK
jgi:hypothetical protein